MAVERDGANTSCSTTAQHCNIPDLLCGSTYTFHVTAMNSFCHSGPSNTFQIQTGANTKSVCLVLETMKRSLRTPQQHPATAQKPPEHSSNHLELFNNQLESSQLLRTTLLQQSCRTHCQMTVHPQPEHFSNYLESTHSILVRECVFKLHRVCILQKFNLRFLFILQLRVLSPPSLHTQTVTAAK